MTSADFAWFDKHVDDEQRRLAHATYNDSASYLVIELFRARTKLAILEHEKAKQ